MIRYLSSLQETETRLDELPLFFEREQMTELEYAAAFDDALTMIEDWEKIAESKMDELLNRVHELPEAVLIPLRRILIERRDADYPAIQGIGIRMPLEEQRRRLPHVIIVTEGLLARIGD